MKTLVLWLPIVAVVAHVIEEFVWPGGFVQWYRNYPPGFSATVSVRFLVIVNFVFAALALLPPVLGSTDLGFAWWVVVAAIAGMNGLFHLFASFQTRSYSPGLVTGLVLYLPLAGFGGTQLHRQGLVSGGTLMQAVLLAVGYQVWSTWNHKRHAVRTHALVIDR